MKNAIVPATIFLLLLASVSFAVQSHPFAELDSGGVLELVGSVLRVNGGIRADSLCIGSDCRSSWPSAGGEGTPLLEGDYADVTSERQLSVEYVNGDKPRMVILSVRANVGGSDVRFLTGSSSASNIVAEMSRGHAVHTESASIIVPPNYRYKLALADGSSNAQIIKWVEKDLGNLASPTVTEATNAYDQYKSSNGKVAIYGPRSDSKIGSARRSQSTVSSLQVSPGQIGYGLEPYGWLPSGTKVSAAGRLQYVSNTDRSPRGPATIVSIVGGGSIQMYGPTYSGKEFDVVLNWREDSLHPNQETYLFDWSLHSVDLLEVVLTIGGNHPTSSHDRSATLEIYRNGALIKSISNFHTGTSDQLLYTFGNNPQVSGYGFDILGAVPQSPPIWKIELP